MAFGTDKSVLFREVSLIQGCPYREVPYNNCAIIDILYYLSSYQYCGIGSLGFQSLCGYKKVLFNL